MAKPFIKWVGGKRQLIPILLDHFPKQEIDTYIEPFLGGGALLLSLKPEMFTGQYKYILTGDINSELIEAYNTIKYDSEQLIKKLLLDYTMNDRQKFYIIRDMDRSESFKDLHYIDRVARFLYLNKTCFNGLYRVNKKGQFNTPFGDYKNPCICDEMNLRECSKFFNDMKVSFQCSSFEDFYDVIPDEKTFAYLDPPYHPITKTSNFTQYSKEGFNQESQESLKKYCDFINSSGGKFLLSNSDCDFIKDLYKDYDIVKVYAKRSINSKGDSRHKITEVLVKNY